MSGVFPPNSGINLLKNLGLNLSLKVLSNAYHWYTSPALKFFESHLETLTKTTDQVCLDHFYNMGLRIAFQSSAPTHYLH